MKRREFLAGAILTIVAPTEMVKGTLKAFEPPPGETKVVTFSTPVPAGTMPGDILVREYIDPDSGFVRLKTRRYAVYSPDMQVLRGWVMEDDPVVTGEFINLKRR